MIGGQMAPKEEDNRVLLDPSESDSPEVELPHSPLLTKKRIFAGAGGMCLALLGAAFVASHQSGSSLRGGNVKNTIKLIANATPSSWFLIKHDVQDDPLFKTHMMAYLSNKTAQAEWTAKVVADGFFNQAFMQTGATGPYYCLWEGAPGKTEEEMQEWIDTSPLSPTIMLAPMVNDVMPIPNELMGGKTPVPSHFAAPAERRLQETEGTALSSFYLIKHEFTSNETGVAWWAAATSLMGNATLWEGWIATVDALGFHNIFFLPTSQDFPAYCLWEAKAGLTVENMTDFIDNSPLSPTMMTGTPALINTVMPLNTSLSMGQLMLMDFFKDGTYGSYFS